MTIRLTWEQASDLDFDHWAKVDPGRVEESVLSDQLFGWCKECGNRVMKKRHAPTARWAHSGEW